MKTTMTRGFMFVFTLEYVWMPYFWLTRRGFGASGRLDEIPLQNVCAAFVFMMGSTIQLVESSLSYAVACRCCVQRTDSG